MRILGIDTSCDETACAVVTDGFRVLSEATRTHDEHRVFGGVVPEIAARAHMRLLPRLTKISLERAGISWDGLDGVAATLGPGLPGALMVGVVFAKTISQALKVPFVGVNHLEGHIFSVLLGQRVDPPFLALIASGGHTDLVHVLDWGRYRVLARTKDDAVGECFDKVARIMDLGYPGGPEIERLARDGNPDFHHFPVPKFDHLGFSYSGLKTSVLYYITRQEPWFVSENISHICASFQEAAFLQLLEVCLGGVEMTGVRKLVVVGGVSVNQALREKFRRAFGEDVIFPDPRYSTDNGAMIAGTGLFRLERGLFTPLSAGVYPSWELDEG
ncbi:MAG: tRNA (adenosine(37)-N6)-threonylcarbamoyltransferase complex transferase subunit TsaD [candidate division WOR-3 bacterium]